MSEIVEEVMDNEVKTTSVVIFGERFNIYDDINNPLFLGADVAELIEYDPDKVGQMLNLVDDNEKLTDTVYRGGQNREMWFVTEFGLYELLMQSRKPRAKQFKLAVKNILKQIRLGTYIPAKTVVKKDNSYTFFNAQLAFRNFSGEKSEINKVGERNFCLVITDTDVAETMKEEGWNIKQFKPRDEDEIPNHYLPVAVRFDIKPPKVFKISGTRKTRLDEEAVGSLDFDEFENVDITVTPSNWTVRGNSGIKAYLKTMYVTLVQDELAAKYDDDEELPFN